MRADETCGTSEKKYIKYRLHLDILKTSLLRGTTKKIRISIRCDLSCKLRKATAYLSDRIQKLR